VKKENLMRLSLSLSIVAALLVAPLAACEFHAEAGHPHSPPPPPPPPQTAAAPAPPAPAPVDTVKTGHLHLTVPDAGA
jgi:hypothetical protein